MATLRGYHVVAFSRRGRREPELHLSIDEYADRALCGAESSDGWYYPIAARSKVCMKCMELAEEDAT